MQHFILVIIEMECLKWYIEPELTIRQNRRQRCGIAGNAVNLSGKLGVHLTGLHRPSLVNWHLAAVFVLPQGEGQVWR